MLDRDMEKTFLESKSDTYNINSAHVHKFAIESYMKIFSEYVSKDKDALELGCSDGYSTELIASIVRCLDVVDGSYKMISKAKENVSYDNVQYDCRLFEDINIDKKYDYIFANYIFEHVNNPEEVVNIAYSLLKNGGYLFVTVPNAKALSRQMAVSMGLLKSLYELTENDKNHGHRRVYDLNTLSELFGKSEFCIKKIGGTFVKQFADFQLDQIIEKKIVDDDYLKAMQELGEKYPDISGSIYIILQKRI